MADDGRKTKGRSPRFARHHALVHNGWLAVLTAAEMKLWNAYEEHARPDGISYPSSSTLALLLGHRNSNHIGRLRDRLRDHGLIDIVETGGGRGHKCTVRMLVPPERSSVGKHSRRGSVSGSGKHSRNEHPNTPETERETLPKRVEHNKDEQHWNSIEHHLPAAAPPQRASAVETVNGLGVEQPPKTAKFPQGVWRRACDGWTRAYEHVHGVRPTITPRAAKSLAAMLNTLGGDLDALASVIRAGLRQPNVGYWQGHKLPVIAENLDFLRAQIANGQIGQPRASPKSDAATAREQRREALLKTVYADMETA